MVQPGTILRRKREEATNEVRAWGDDSPYHPVGMFVRMTFLFIMAAVAGIHFSAAAKSIAKLGRFDQSISTLRLFRL